MGTRCAGMGNGNTGLRAERGSMVTGHAIVLVTGHAIVMVTGHAIVSSQVWVQSDAVAEENHPCRLILYPALLPRFWFVLEGFPMWERVGVVTCQ